ncbi:MAG: hypothetical protein WC829_18385, partial [Hyphomicrobium sp.]
MRWRSLAVGVVSGLALVSAASAQQADSQMGAKRLAAAESLPAAAPAVAPATAPQDPIGQALQQKLAVRVRADEGEAQDRAALSAYYATQAFAPMWVAKTGLNDKGRALIAEFGKANDWGLEAADFAVPTLAPVA